MVNQKTSMQLLIESNAKLEKLSQENKVAYQENKIYYQQSKDAYDVLLNRFDALLEVLEEKGLDLSNNEILKVK